MLKSLRGFNSDRLVNQFDKRLFTPSQYLFSIYSILQLFKNSGGIFRIRQTVVSQLLTGVFIKQIDLAS